jgi:hypothetical protein
LPHGQMFYQRPNFDNFSGVFMSNDHRRWNRAARPLVPIVDVQISSTYPCSPHLD